MNTPLLYVVHHAESTLPNKVASGWDQSSVDERAPDVMGDAGAKLVGKDYGDLYTSPLPRVEQSARLLGAKLGRTPINLPGLTTWNTGDWTGQPQSVVHPLMDAARLLPDYTPPNGESYATAFKRWHVTFTKGMALGATRGKPPVFVTSSNPMKALPFILSGGSKPLINPYRPKPGAVVAITRNMQGQLTSHEI